MKRAIQIILSLLLAVLMLSMAACSGNAPKADYPEHYEEISAVLGESRETVLKKLDLNADDLVKGDRSLYAVPFSCTYSGIDFEVQLEFDEANDRLIGFWLYKEWKDQWDTAARDVGALAKALTGAFGEARTDIDPERFSDMSAEQLAEAFRNAASKDMQVGTDWWLVEKRSAPAIRDYMKILQAQDQPAFRIADYLNLTLEMKVNASEAASAAGVQLRFRLEGEPTGSAK